MVVTQEPPIDSAAPRKSSVRAPHRSPPATRRHRRLLRRRHHQQEPPGHHHQLERRRHTALWLHARGDHWQVRPHPHPSGPAGRRARDPPQAQRRRAHRALRDPPPPQTGELLHISLTISPIRDIAGRIVGISKIARDITERKQTEAALFESERIAAMGRMAASIAHEVNNPLEAILNISYLLSKHPSLDEEARAYTHLLLNEVTPHQRNHPADPLLLSRVHRHRTNRRRRSRRRNGPAAPSAGRTEIHPPPHPVRAFLLHLRPPW